MRRPSGSRELEIYSCAARAPPARAGRARGSRPPRAYVLPGISAEISPSGDVDEAGVAVSIACLQDARVGLLWVSRGAIARPWLPFQLGLLHRYVNATGAGRAGRPRRRLHGDTNVPARRAYAAIDLEGVGDWGVLFLATPTRVS
jgi:hypothetical protein